jgi:hypothetical protein
MMFPLFDVGVNVPPVDVDTVRVATAEDPPFTDFGESVNVRSGDIVHIAVFVASVWPELSTDQYVIVWTPQFVTEIIPV